MDRINYTRVVTGGLLAGLIINVGEFVLNEPILGALWKTTMANRRGRWCLVVP